MDKLIREVLQEKAEVVQVPAGAWKRIRREMRPVPWWRRYRLGSRIELVAAVAAFVVIVVLGAALPALRPGPVDREVPSVTIPVAEQRIADQRSIGENLLKLGPLMPRGFDREPAVGALQEANRLLQPFGYRIERAKGGSAFAVYQGEELVLGGLNRFGPVTVSDRQDDFIFLASDAPDEHWLVRASGPQAWDLAEFMRHRYQPPVYVGSDLIAVRWEPEQAFVVWRNEERAFTVPLDGQPAGNAIKRLLSWSGHWVLEVAGTVYIDGRSLNDELGYAEIFEWRLVNGKPFYLFRKGKHFGISYDGQVLPYRYDEVPHYLCCEATPLNPRGNESVVYFFGRRGRDWYWIEVGSGSTDHFLVNQPEFGGPILAESMPATAEISR